MRGGVFVKFPNTGSGIEGLIFDSYSTWLVHYFFPVFVLCVFTFLDCWDEIQFHTKLAIWSCCQILVISCKFVIFIQIYHAHFNLLQHHVLLSCAFKRTCPVWGLNSRPSDYETDALPAAPTRLTSRSLSLRSAVTTVTSHDRLKRLSTAPERPLELLLHIKRWATIITQLVLSVSLETNHWTSSSPYFSSLLVQRFTKANSFFFSSCSTSFVCLCS